MFKNDIEFFILCAILLIVFLFVIGGFISMRIFIKSYKRREEELYRITYSLVKRTRDLDDDYYSLKEQNQQYANDIKRLQEMINSLGVLAQKNSSSISSLTSSINNVIQENTRRMNEKIYPTPQLSEMIRTTIGEFLHQEITLIRDMRIPVSPTDPVTVKIARNVMLTYPHVDEVWIQKKVIEVIQEAVRE
jgi:hypothetical protein